MNRSVHTTRALSLVVAVGAASCSAPADGGTSLVRFAAEPAGTACAAGGQRIEAGVDDDGDGTLDTAEVDSTAYLCAGVDGTPGTDGTNGTPGTDGTNGTPGTDGADGTPGVDGAPGADGSDGFSSLLSVTSEAAGAHCAQGGVRIDAGVDDDRNGQLDAGEVDTSAYVCDGEDGVSAPGSLIELRPVAAGAECPNGGQLVVTGIDDDGDGTLAVSEEDASAYVCAGTDGAAGVDGANALVRITTVLPSPTGCLNGGVLVRVGSDVDGNGDLDPSEVDDQATLCEARVTARIAIELGPLSDVGDPGDSVSRLVPLLLARGHSVTVVVGTQIDTQAEIDAYDVVVLADSQALGGTKDYAAFDPVVSAYVAGGGGIVFGSWFPYIDGQNATNLIGLCPVELGRGLFAGATAVSSAPMSTLAPGLSFVSPEYTPYGTAKPGATPWLVAGSTAVAVGRAVGAGRTSFVGPMFLDSIGSYANETLLDGSQPQAIEFYLRAIEWTAAAR